MGRSSETFGKKEVQNRREKKRKEKEKKRLARKEGEKKGLDDMIAYVDEFGRIVDTPPDPNQKEEIDIDSIQVSVSKKTEEESSPIRKGTVSFFNESKGYGFIRDLESKQSVFVHVNNVLEPITEGNLVNFEIEKGPKGMNATHVTKAK